LALYSGEIVRQRETEPSSLPRVFIGTPQSQPDTHDLRLFSLPYPHFFLDYLHL
jgi:hypothetical protein